MPTCLKVFLTCLSLVVTCDDNNNNSKLGAGNTPNDVFATHVVKKILQPVSPKYITYGATSWVFLLFYYLPFFIKDLIFYKKFGVDQLKPKKD